MLKKFSAVIGIILGMSAIITIAYGGFEFYSCKADKSEVAQLSQIKADRIELELVANDLYIYKLQQRRKYVQERIWDIQRAFPNNYMNNQEYRNLVQELKQIDVQISAYYRKGGK